jgi:hypothetical protein
MLEVSLGSAIKRVTAATMIAVVVSGCSQVSAWLSPGSDSDSVAPEGPAISAAPTAEDYLLELAVLSSGDPALQAEIFANSEVAAQLAPNPSTMLRFALVLATPGHPESDPRQAQSLLRELMNQQAFMTPAEVALATIYLDSTEELIGLSSQARQARATSDRAQRTEEAAINQRLATAEAENRRLQQDLEEAESKLEAITSIEQSIREQDQ